MACPLAVVVAIVAVAAIACSGERKPAPEMPSSGPAAVKVMAPDTMVRRMDSAAAARAADSIAQPKNPKKP